MEYPAANTKMAQQRYTTIRGHYIHSKFVYVIADVIITALMRL